MRKNPIIFLLLFIILLCRQTYAVRYLEVSHEDRTLYTDQFAAGNLSDWNVLIDNGKKWYAEDIGGETVLTAEKMTEWKSTTMAVPLKGGAANYCITTDVTPKENFDHMAIVFRAQSSTAFYRYSILWEQGVITDISLQKHVNCHEHKAQVLAKGTASSRVNQKVNLKLEMVDNTMKAYFNNVLIMEYTDSENPITSGTAGLMQDYGRSYFHNFNVTRLDSKAKEPENKETKKYQNVSLYEAEEIKDFSDSLYDFYGWDDHAAKILYPEAEGISLNPPEGQENIFYHSASYQRRKFQNEDMAFRLMACTKGTEFKNYFGVAFGSVMKNADFTGENDGYMLRVTKDTIAFEKYMKGDTIILGQCENKKIFPNVYNAYQIRLSANKDVLNMSLDLDGETVLTAEDGKKPILSGGYISLISYENSLIAAPLQEKEKTIKQKLGNAIVLAADCPNISSMGVIKKITENDRTAVPYMENNILMVPLRFLAQESGAEVFWNESLHMAEVTFEEKTYGFSDGYGDYFFEDERYPMRACSAIKEGVMYVPAEALERCLDKGGFTCANGLTIFASPEELQALSEDSLFLDEVKDKLFQ